MKVYDRVILSVFQRVHQLTPDAHVLPFTKGDIEHAIAELSLGIATKNVPDIVYTYRSGRSALPDAITQLGRWAIEGAGKGKYQFRLLQRSPYFDIPSDIEITKIPDATPDIVLKHQGSDEQALIARVRYNRLVDIFTSLTCYHLQSHFRTTVKGIGQIEIDDLYIGIDANGEGFIIPIEAKIASEKDRLGVIQVTQMVGLTRQNFSELAIRPIGIKEMPDGGYMMLEFTPDTDPNEVATKRYKRYRLVRD